MYYTFDDSYINNSEKAILMIVANSVVGDSRVIKSAYSLSKMGFKVDLVGIAKVDKPQCIEGFPFKVTLVPNPKKLMFKKGLWWIDESKSEYDVEGFIDAIANNIYNVVKRNKYDYLHSHDMYGLGIGAFLTAKMNFDGWVHDVHEYVEGCTHIPEFIRLYALGVEEQNISKVDSVLTVSPILRDILSRKYGLKSISVVYNTPYISSFDKFAKLKLKDKLNIKEENKLIVYNGSVKEARGVHTVLEAMVNKKEVHFALLTDSKGDYMNYLLQLAIKLGISERFHTHPYVPNHQVSSFIADADLGISPLTIYGNTDLAYPTKIFEYLHAGINFISSNTTAIKDFVNEYEVGYIFEAENSENLADVIDSALETVNNESTKSRLRELSNKYSWENQEYVFNAIYHELGNDSASQACLSSTTRILQLPTHAANQPGTLAVGFRNKGFEATHAVLGENKFKYADDFKLIPQSQTFSAVSEYLTNQKLEKYDIFHYHFRPLIYYKDFGTPTGFDIFTLKALGKKVFYHFRGSEIRLSQVFREKCPYNYVDEQDNSVPGFPYKFDDAEQIKFRNFVMGVCDQVFVNDPELQGYVPNSLIVPRAISFDKVEQFSVQKNSIPLIVHAPSRSSIKGTDSVLKAISKLKDDGFDFDFRLIEGMPHSEALKLYRKADILIDQLRIGWFGVLAVEGMANKCAVISYIRDDLKHYLPLEPPICYANPDNIYDVVGYLLSDPEARESVATNGYDYVRSHHDVDSICSKLTRLYAAPFKGVNVERVSQFFESNHSLFVNKLKRRYRTKPLEVEISDTKKGKDLQSKIASTSILHVWTSKETSFSICDNKFKELLNRRNCSFFFVYSYVDYLVRNNISVLDSSLDDYQRIFLELLKQSSLLSKERKSSYSKVFLSKISTLKDRR